MNKDMKRIFFLWLMALVLMGLNKVHAQGFNEWLRQKATQKKYLLEQIAALKVYTGYLKKGYKIGKDGLDLIGNIKDGDFNLHKGYFNSLKSVNPEIKRYPKLADAIALQEKILVTQSRARKQLRENSMISVTELDYCNRVFDRLLKDCDNTMDELLATISNGQWSMKDDERLQRIDEIYNDMLDKYLFVVQFASSALELDSGRKMELTGIKDALILNGIK